MCKIYRDPADCDKAPACDKCSNKGAYNADPTPETCDECQQWYGKCGLGTYVCGWTSTEEDGPSPCDTTVCNECHFLVPFRCAIGRC